MAKVKITKTQMCKLVADHLDDLDTMVAAPKSRDASIKKVERFYFFSWFGGDFEIHVSLSCLSGKPYLRFFVYDDDVVVEEKFLYLDRELMLSRGILQEVA